MSEFKPTVAQAAAISARGGAVLVSAGAGSGKTKVLTERLMSYICDAKDPKDIDGFLVITFTKAAAEELRGRITQALSEALAQDPSNRRLRRQNALCQRAQIGTIHSFCATLLRENCQQLALPPDFKIADKERASAMKAAALERTLEHCYEEPERFPGFLALADTVGAGRDDSRLSALMLSLSEKMQCHARPELWAREQIERLNSGAADVGETQWGAEILSRTADTVDYWCDEFDRLMAAMNGVEKIKNAYMPSVSETADELAELRRRLRIGWDSARECLPINFPNLGRVVKSPDPELSDMVKLRRETCRKAMKGLEDTLYSDSAKLLAEMELTAPAMKALLNVTLEFERRFAADKRRRGFVDYSDLEHMAAELLTDEKGAPTETARLVSRRFTEIMVDEYQDVSQVQDTIFRAVSRDGSNLFLVGDVKQSIYRFRLADPGIFTEKYLTFKDYAQAVPGDARRVLLRENFRSRREVLEAANSLFTLCMSRKLGEIDYDDKAALICGADYPGEGAKPELLLLSLPESAEDEETPDKVELEADMVALRIRALMDSDVTVTERGIRRPLEYSDFAVLLRAANAIGPAYSKALAARGIPSSVGQSGGFFRTVEVSTVTSLLALIDNPYQDIPLIAVLSSPVFGFTPDELSMIRSSDKNGGLYSALIAAAENDKKSADFISRLAQLRAAAPDVGTGELLTRIYSELGLSAIFSAMSGGRQRRANLYELLSLAERFESGGYKGLHRFVLWLKEVEAKRRESLGSPDGPCVQILSIHKSKGLEFPVVFVCDLARGFNRQDSRESVLIHPQLGLGPKLCDRERMIEYPTLARNAIRLRLESEMLSEEMRLLYVALTRARERLYLTAAVKRPEELIAKSAASVTVPMSPETLRSAKAPVNWLIYSAIADEGRTMKMSTVTGVEGEETAPALAAAAMPDAATLSELERNLAFVYPYKQAQELPSKVTATELKTAAEPDADAAPLLRATPRVFRAPELSLGERPLTGAERGVATHLVLQYMDYARTGSSAEIKQEIERLCAAGFISQRERDAVNVSAIRKLFASALGTRILTAEETHREFKFSLLCPAQELFGSAGDERVLLQGVVDCCLVEHGGLVIIDYKTDRVADDAQLAERSRFYEGQLRAYSAALTRIYGMPVRECVLYFLSAARAVSLN